MMTAEKRREKRTTDRDKKGGGGICGGHLSLQREMIDSSVECELWQKNLRLSTLAAAYSNHKF